MDGTRHCFLQVTNNEINLLRCCVHIFGLPFLMLSESLVELLEVSLSKVLSIQKHIPPKKKIGLLVAEKGS